MLLSVVSALGFNARSLFPCACYWSNACLSGSISLFFMVVNVGTLSLTMTQPLGKITLCWPVHNDKSVKNAKENLK